jgi:alpha-galactosidase
VLFAGSKSFGFREGEVWGVHLGWSGGQRYLLQRLNTGTTIIGTGEILAPGEVILGPGEQVTTAWAYAVYSGSGIDGASARLHSMLRRRAHHPVKPRPVLLNTWEAVRFDQSFERLAHLADVAAEVGVERFVIDDGWFGSRRDPSSGLGDWYVAEDVWPGGLHPIVDHVRALGMDFGLWFEPEMVNLSSDLARAHPEMNVGARAPFLRPEGAALFHLTRQPS